MTVTKVWIGMTVTQVELSKTVSSRKAIVKLKKYGHNVSNYNIYNSDNYSDTNISNKMIRSSLLI